MTFIFFPQAKPIPGIKIFRFESAMFYANSEYFRSTLIEMTGVDPQNPNKRSRLGSSAVRYRHNEEGTGSPAIEITRTVSINRALENGVELILSIHAYYI